DVKINGFASSSFKAEPKPPIAHDTAPNQLHDARGMSLAFDPNTSPPLFTSRDVSIRGKPSEDGSRLSDERLSLVTLRKPIPLAIGHNELRLWFRDLPMVIGDKLVFDRSGGIETGFGPDPQAINRNRLANTLYEWRLYPVVDAHAKGADALGQFEF